VKDLKNAKNVRDVNFDGSLLRTARLKSGATQKHFASLLGISRNYLYMLENGLRSPGEKLLKKISLCTDIPTGTFLKTRSRSQDVSDETGKADCILELTNRLNRERYGKKVSEGRNLELEKRNEHLIALNSLLLQANRVYRLQITVPEKAKKLAAIARETAKAGELCFDEIAYALDVEPPVLTRWLEAVITVYACKLFPENSVSAFTPSEAGAKLCCFDCDAREKGDCRGFGEKIHPENTFAIISMLEANGITSRSEQAEIISKGSDREITAHQVSDLMSRKKHGLPIPENLLYLTSVKRK
jgi:transcriptional regulator with XRE-family HTH domain